MGRLAILGIVAIAICLTGCIKVIPLGLDATYVKPNIDTIAAPIVDIAALRSMYPNERGVMLGYNVRGFESAWLSDENYMHVRSERYVILDAKADDLTNISEAFHTEVRMLDADVLVFHPDGTREQYGLADFTVTQSGQRWNLYRLPIKHATVGTVVDMSWAMVSHSSMKLSSVEPTYLRHSIPSLAHDIEITRPGQFTFEEKEAPAIDGLKIDRRIEGDVLRYRTGMQPAARDEKFAPIESIRRARLDYCTKPVSLAGYMGGDFWADHQRHMYRWYFREDSYDLMKEPEFAKAHRSILDGARDELDTLQRLKSWISTNIKIDYNKESSESASSVFHSRVGSVWGAALLARQLYQIAGFTTRIVQLHSLNEGVFDWKYSNIGEFREIALVVSRDTTRYLVLVQRPLQPVNVVPAEYVGQPFVYVDTDQKGRSVETDVSFVTDTSSVSRNVSVTLDEDGFAHVKLAVTYRGDAALDERTNLDELPETELENILKKRFIPELAEATNVEVAVENLMDPTLSLVLRASFSVAEALTMAEGEMIFQTAGILSPVSEAAAQRDSSDRQNPIEITSPYRYVRHVDVHFPAAWTLRTTIDENEVHSDLGDLKRTRTINQGALTVEFSSSLKAGTYAQRYASDLVNVLGNSGTSSIPALVFETKR